MNKAHREGAMRENVEYLPSPVPSGGMLDELSLLDFLIIVLQRKRLVAVVTMLCTAIALLIAFLLPREYTATVIILPPQGSSSMGSMLASQLAGMNAVSGRSESTRLNSSHSEISRMPSSA